MGFVSVSGIFLTAILAISSITTESAQAAEIEDHPLISRYTDSIPTRRDEEEFQNYKLITKVIADSLEFDSITLGGRLTRIGYENPKDRSSLEILANYEQAIVGAVGVAKRRHQITIIEVQNMETGLVEIDPAALGQELDQLGHVAIPGVYFETGKAELSTESRQALEAIAVILKERPNLSVWIVGHTDWTGSFKLNSNLSDARAKAVATALSKSHGIAATRLEGHGVGPLAPTASNQSDAGRTANRRVELVARR